MIEVHIQQGDITKCEVDAVVNAANNELILGGGVAGAIARAGGPEIQQQCDHRGPIEVGQAAITTAGNMPAKHVIHQASMRLGGATTAEALQRSTEAVLRLAEENDVKTLAFPAVGTGIAGFDTHACARIMLDAVGRHGQAGSAIREVTFVLFDKRSYDIFVDEARR